MSEKITYIKYVLHTKPLSKHRYSIYTFKEITVSAEKNAFCDVDNTSKSKILIPDDSPFIEKVPESMGKSRFLDPDESPFIDMTNFRDPSDVFKEMESINENESINAEQKMVLTQKQLRKAKGKHIFNLLFGIKGKETAQEEYGGFSDNELNFNGSSEKKHKKFQFSFFEDESLNEDVLDSQLKKLINTDGYYDEIKPEDYGEEYSIKDTDFIRKGTFLIAGCSLAIGIAVFLAYETM